MNTTKKTYWSLFVVAVVYATLIMLLPQGGFWTTDGGNKFIIIQNVCQNGTPDIDYPAASLDPVARFFPDAGFHFQKHSNGKITSFYPPYYPYLCSVLTKLSGWYGIFVLSVISGLICVGLTWCISRKMDLNLPPPLLIFALAFGTPFCFYSLVLWEHMFSIIFASAALLLVIDETFTERVKTRVAVYATAGNLLAISCWFREESYLFFGAVSLALLLLKVPWKRLAALGTAWFAMMLPLWIYQYFIFGHPLGSHALGYQALAQLTPSMGFTDAIWLKVSNFYVFLLKFAASAPGADPWSALAVIPVIAVVLSGIFLKEDRVKAGIKAVLLPLASLGSIVLTAKLFLNPEPILNTIFTQGLLSAVPLLIVLAMEIRPLWQEKAVFRFVLLTWLCFTLAACLFLNQGELGLIWGPRHYLVMMPLLVPLAAYALVRMRTHGDKIILASGAVLFLCSIAIQVHGIIALFVKKEASVTIVRQLEKTQPQLIVTDVFWLGEECASIFYRKKFMCVNNDADLNALTELFKQRGIKDFTLVLSTRPNYRRISNEALGRLLRQVETTQPQVISSPRVGFMTLVVTDCRIR